MAAVPDMSHLTPEERSTIEEVMTRHKEEEEKENEIMRRKQNEVKVLEERIRVCSEQHKKAGVELNATCHICLKTKFADGVGHICNYCRIRCCARCGGKVTLRSSKVIWVCILCRKKQELLSKTGQWMTKTGLSGAENAMPRRTSDLQVGGPPGLVDQTQDKRPKLERAHSAAEKENLPLLQRSGSLLRRQYSQQEQIPPRRLSTSDSGVEMSMSPHSRALPTPHVTIGSYPVQQASRYLGYSEDDPTIYRSEIDDLMKQYQPSYHRQRPIYPDQTDLAMAYGEPIAGPPRTTIHPVQHHSVQGPHPSQQPSQASLQQQRSFSSSEEERSTPECPSDEPDESEKGKGYYHTGDPMSMSSGGRRHHGSRNGHHTAGSMTIEYNGHHPPREPRKEESTIRRSFRRSGDEWRSDSRRFTERRGKKTVRFDGGTNAGGSQEDWSWEADRQGSQDSATKDSGIDTSSNFTSSEDSNRGDLPKRSLSWQSSRDGQKLIGRMVLRKQVGSGSSSSILGLKVVGGKLLEDGSVGALIEKVKKGSTADIEGQLRPGDEVIKWNGRSLQGKSFREVYDIIAASRQEPRVELVVSRNLGSMTMSVGPTPSTPLATRRITPQTQWRQKHESMPGTQQPHHKELYDARREKPSVLVTSPGSPDLHAQGRARHLRQVAGNANIGGNLQVKLSYDSVALRLIVTLVCAAGLTSRSNGQPRNPYAKIFLLPDKSEQSKRRTNTLANTNDPKWNQTFVYEGIRVSELRKRTLEITVWDYGRCDANDFLGEVVIDLGLAPLHDELEWHPLTTHGEHRHIGHYPEPNDMVINPVDRHLSPPSTTSRLSDSDTSECDIADCDGSREHRRTTDGSSIGSSSSHYSSPPPEREFCVDTEHRSRRDMSPQSRKRAALMIRDQPASISGYQTYRKEDIHRGMMGHRSYSAAPMDSPSIRYRGRSQSPTGHRSLSPPEHRSIPYSHGYGPRFSSRSATATPTGSPKKRQLPLIPAALKERAVQDLEERARFMRHRNRQVHTTYKSTGMGGWERHYSGLSDSNLPSIGHNPPSLPHSHAYRMHRPRKGHLSPEKDVFGDFGDSDMESIASVTSSALSTQSERPRGSRGLIPTVKNVLIPGVISPMPPPPRRNRRRHRLRVPCSECHCPNNNPTKPRSNNPGKHNPTPHPLVRSKSAVVRSLYRKMRTPFTRSQTVDENMLRYYSPETSEYSVSEGFILKPEELTGSSKKRIPEIYVEDCLQVDFNDRLIEKFRDKYSSPYLLDSGARRRSRSWQDRTASRSAKARQQFFSRGALYDFADDLGIRNLDVSLRPRRSFLFSKARSFDYDVLHDAYGNRYGIGLPTGTGLLSRRAKSFEYENISSNIFSDDSLRTARRKLKRNLSINDAGYGDKIPALGDRSRSYYDSNGDDKIPKSLLHQQKNYDYLLRQDHKPFYGYDSELSAGETEIYLPAFDKKTGIGLSSLDYRSYGSRLPGETGFSSDDQIGLRDVLGREDPAKRKYIDSAYQDRDSSFDRDIFSEKRTRNFVDSDMSDSVNDHIYCSIDEAMSAGEGYPHRDRYDRHRGAVRPRRRTKSSESYLEDGYDGYGNWDVDYDEGFVDRGNVDDYDRRLYDYDNEEDMRVSRADRSLYDDRYYHERMEDGARRTSHRKRSAQYVGDADTYIADDYSGYRSAEDYDYRTHDPTPECCREAYHQDNTFPRRRRRRSRRGSRDVPSTVVYENLRPYRRDAFMKDTLSVPSFAESKRMMLQRAESTPVLPSDDDLSSSAERARRMYRRRRNSSCPESRELRYYDSPRRKDVEPSTSIMLASDEEFGSMETVVGADYFRRKAAEESRMRDGSRAVYYDAVQDRGGYVEPQCDYEECEECIYERTRGVSRSGSLRSSGEGTRYYRIRRKSSCPECRELALAAAELTRSGSLSRRGEDRRGSVESRPRYRRRNSSCPEARELELLDRRQQEQRLSQREQEGQQPGPPGQQQQQQQQQGSKRNVAISDTLEYYEYSMESESQCSENCGFGPCDPRRPRNRAPRPGNANSSLFDSQTATSDTAKNYHPRAADHHENSRNTKPTPRDHHPVDDSGVDSYSPTSSTRRRSRKQSIYDDTDLPPDQRRDYDSTRDRRSSSMPESSEYNSQSGSYEKTPRHQLTDNGHDEPDKRGQFTRSLSNADGPSDEKVDGSLSDTAIGLNVDNGSRRGRKSSPGSKSGSGSSSGGGSAVQYQSGLGKKSNSTSQLSATECGIGGSIVGGSLLPEPRGLGISSRKRNSTPCSIHRSEEIMPTYQHFDSSKSAGSAASDTAGSLNSISSSDGRSWSPSLRMASETGPLRNFIKDLGPGQIVGRQALGAACLGEIELSLIRKNGFLEIEVIRAKDLKNEENKAPPASYVKVYLVSGKKCIAKAKTTPARATLEPFYKQVLKLPYRDTNRGCILQVTVWSDYGRLGGRKGFMGIAQIVLDELNLEETKMGWYKLFGNTSL